MGIGFENRSYTISGVKVEDVDMIHVQRGAAIGIHDGDTGVGENVSYDNIRVEDARRKLMDFAVVYAPYEPDKPASEAETSGRMDRGGAWDANLCYLPAEKAAPAGRQGISAMLTVANLQIVGGGVALQRDGGIRPGACCGERAD